MTHPLSGRQTFRKPERLVSRLLFERLLREGNRIQGSPIRLLWIRSPLATPYPVQVAFSVPKRNFRRAVDRNRIKRLLRESYRKNKSGLYSLLSGRSQQYALLFVFHGQRMPDHHEIESQLTSLLQRFAKATQ